MNILIITRRFYPEHEAATSCVANLIEAMGSLGHQVSVMALSCKPPKELPSHWHEVPIHWAYTPTAAERSEWKQVFHSHPIRCAQYLLGKTVDRALRLCKPSLHLARVFPLRLCAFRKALSKLLNSHRFDACIATLYPLEAGLAVQGLRGHPPCYIYQLDAYWNNADMPQEVQSACKHLLQGLFAKANGVFTTPAMLPLYQSEGMTGVTPMISCEFPMLREIESPVCLRQWGEPEDIHLAFVGTLYPCFRSPETLVMLLAHLDLNVSVCFVGGGQELLTGCKGYEQAKDKIICLGRQSLETALVIEASADVLVNIDNSHNAYQVPSKIFEYMSQGKPIVNLSTNPLSGTLAYLARYPLVLILRVNEMSQADMLASIKAFLLKNRDQRVAFSQVEALFPECTPEYVAKRICGMIQEHCKQTTLDSAVTR